MDGLFLTWLKGVGMDIEVSRVYEISSEGAYFYTLATDAANEGDNPKALEYIEKVIATDPKYALAWHVKGNCLDGIGRCDDALKCYNTAIRLDPYNSESWFNKGTILKKLGRKKQADTCLKKAVKLSIGQ